MQINNEIFKSHLYCLYKAYLKIKNYPQESSEHQNISFNLKRHHENLALDYLISKYKSKEIGQFPTLTHSILKQGYKLIINTTININGIHCYLNAIEQNNCGQNIFSYMPVLFVQNEKVSRIDKMMVVFSAFVLNKIQRYPSEFGKIIYGNQFRSIKVKIKNLDQLVSKHIGIIKSFIEGRDSTSLFLKRNCDICEYIRFCRSKALEEDHLSLLHGISEKEVQRQNKKGIFTVTQFSYTFRPRRKRKYAKNSQKKYSFALKALSIRENKIHIFSTSSLPKATAKVYIDIEGDPDRNFHYLIGMIIDHNGLEKKYSLWADNEEDELNIAREFTDIIKSIPDFCIFHYGSYEMKFFRKLKNILTEVCPDLIEKIIGNSVNVLSFIYANIYFPTYSNGLKEIGKYLGCQWSENITGINSIVLRKQFELSNNQEYKQRLITYNQEDCLALKEIVTYIDKLIAYITSTQDSNTSHDFVHVDNLKEEWPLRWGKVHFVFPELEKVNNCAYFDYQREIVFTRTNKRLAKIYTLRRIRSIQSYRVNKHIDIPIQRECPICGEKTYKNGKNCSKKVIDLMIYKGGIRRLVIAYRTSRTRCFRCKLLITPIEFKAIKRYGYGLKCWILYNHIVNCVPFNRIHENLWDFFEISLTRTTLHTFKKDLAEYHMKTYQNILNKLLKGKIIHVDETRMNIKGKDEFVWVFSNMEEVYFLHTPNREGQFLKVLLKDFNGILISDFYAAYDSLECKQQKCLIHLIRDLNDDLIKNPFDKGYKNMVAEFSSLLSTIIHSVDKYGLKKRHLKKYKKKVKKFFNKISKSDYGSELTQKYQTRFQKNRDKLFAFLDFDGVPWNNNNAEHAIKHFATHRRIMENSGGSTEARFKDYLILLSIYQTCKYRGVNFIKFLLSKKQDIDEFHSR